MINRIVLIGRLVRDPELRKTKENVSVVGFSIAVDNPPIANGEKTTSFFECTAWNALADNIVKYTHKGSLIGIEGRLQQRTYVNKSNVNVSVVEIIVSGMQLLDKKSDNVVANNNVAPASAPAPVVNTPVNPAPVVNAPVNNVAPTTAPTNQAPLPEINDADLPF